MLVGPDDMARQIQHRHQPGWLVWYGRRTGQYWALAAWTRAQREMLGAATPGALDAAMTAFEALHPKPLRSRRPCSG